MAGRRLISINLTEDELYLVVDGLGYSMKHGIEGRAREIKTLYDRLDAVLNDEQGAEEPTVRGLADLLSINPMSHSSQIEALRRITSTQRVDESLRKNTYAEVLDGRFERDEVDPSRALKSLFEEAVRMDIERNVKPKLRKRGIIN